MNADPIWNQLLFLTGWLGLFFASWALVAWLMKSAAPERFHLALIALAGIPLLIAVSLSFAPAAQVRLEQPDLLRTLAAIALAAIPLIVPRRKSQRDWSTVR